MLHTINWEIGRRERAAHAAAVKASWPRNGDDDEMALLPFKKWRPKVISILKGHRIGGALSLAVEQRNEAEDGQKRLSYESPDAIGIAPSIRMDHSRVSLQLYGAHPAAKVERVLTKNVYIQGEKRWTAVLPLPIVHQIHLINQSVNSGQTVQRRLKSQSTFFFLNNA